jgi:hypothetical protein
MHDECSSCVMSITYSTDEIRRLHALSRKADSECYRDVTSVGREISRTRNLWSDKVRRGGSLWQCLNFNWS